MMMGVGRMMGRSQPQFNPAHLPHCVFFFDHQSRRTLNGANVAQVNDRSGNDNHAAQATEANQPDDLASGINSLRNVDYVPGNSDALTITDAASIQNIFDGGGYVSGAVRMDTEGTLGAFRYIIDAGAWIIVMAANKRLRFDAFFSGDSGAWLSPTDSVVLETPFIFGVSYDSDDTGNDPVLTVDGASLSVTESTAPTGTRSTDAGTDKTVGNLAALSRPWDGPMASLAWYDQEPSAFNKTRLDRWFSKINGIALA